jgi:hypothetical protein
MPEAPVLTPDAEQASSGTMTPDSIAAGIVTKQLDFALAALGQHTLRRNVHNYNGSLLAYTHQCNMANQLGLSDEQKRQIAPFPDARANNVSVVTTVAQPAEARTTVHMPPVAEPAKPAASPLATVAEAVKTPARSLFRRALPWIVTAGLSAAGLGGLAAVVNQFWPRAEAVAPNVDNRGEVGLEVE